MEHFPLLPGYTYHDFTRTKYHVPHKLEYKNGFPIVKAKPLGIGEETLDVDGVRYVKNPPPGLYDPALTFGKCDRRNVKPFVPHFVKFDKKCLSFKGYFTQEVPNSPEETHRIRKIELVYFLEDDTLLVREPAVENAGFPQGRLVTRSRVLKEDGHPFHWKDINNRMTIPINGTQYHLCSCDRFTREFLERQGVEVEEDAEIPKDPYTGRRTMQGRPCLNRPPPDRYTRFLMYDKKVLRFTGIWDNRASEYGDIEEYHILYYPEDDTMEILKRSKRRETEPTAPLLARIKVPKNWKKLRATFPAESQENFYEHREETYLPHDLIVGKTIDVFGRKINLIDCDKATRAFYDKVLRISQPLPISKTEETETAAQAQIQHTAPPHDPPIITRTKLEILPPYSFKNIRHNGNSWSLLSVDEGGHEQLKGDILPEWHKFTPQPPKTDLVCYLTNMNKILRYSAKFDVIHPEDEMRRFIIEYRLSDGCLKIVERRLRNTGFQGGKFFGYQLVPKPYSNPENPEFYTPMDFKLGGVINVFGHRFIITGADLAVYRHMKENTEHFKPETIKSLQDYLMKEGLLEQEECDGAKGDPEKAKEAVSNVKVLQEARDVEALEDSEQEPVQQPQRRCRFADE